MPGGSRDPSGRPTATASTGKRSCWIPTGWPSSARTSTTVRPPAGRGDNCATALRSVVVDPAAYDWEGDRPLTAPRGREVIYEMHVGAFTAHRSSGVAEPRARDLCRA